MQHNTDKGGRAWAPALLDLHRIWCEAMDKARAAGMSDAEAADAVGVWLRSELSNGGAR